MAKNTTNGNPSGGNRNLIGEMTRHETEKEKGKKHKYVLSSGYDRDRKTKVMYVNGVAYTPEKYGFLGNKTDLSSVRNAMYRVDNRGKAITFDNAVANHAVAPDYVEAVGMRSKRGNIGFGDIRALNDHLVLEHQREKQAADRATKAKEARQRRMDRDVSILSGVGSREDVAKAYRDLNSAFTSQMKGLFGKQGDENFDAYDSKLYNPAEMARSQIREASGQGDGTYRPGTPRSPITSPLGTASIVFDDSGRPHYVKSGTGYNRMGVHAAGRARAADEQMHSTFLTLQAAYNANKNDETLRVRDYLASSKGTQARRNARVAYALRQHNDVEQDKLAGQLEAMNRLESAGYSFNKETNTWSKGSTVPPVAKDGNGEPTAPSGSGDDDKDKV